jgi:hypothetical protein
MGCKSESTSKENSKKLLHLPKVETNKQVNPKSKILESSGVLKSITDKKLYPSLYQDGWKVYFYQFKSPQNGNVSLTLFDRNNQVMSVNTNISQGESIPILFTHQRKIWSKENVQLSLSLGVKDQVHSKTIELAIKGIKNFKYLGAMAGGPIGFSMKKSTKRLLHYWIWTDKVMGLNYSIRKERLILSREMKTIKLQNFPNSVWQLFIEYSTSK